MLNKKFICIALITFILSVSAVCDWEDRKGAPPVVYLSQIMENPESWLDVPVRIPLRFSSIRDIYTAYFTAFDRDRHLNFSAWDIHTHVWQKKGFLNDYPFFYVEKDAKEFKAFLRLKKFDTIAVMGKVVSIFRGKPYFKIVWVCKQSGNLNVHNLTLLNRASAAYENRMFDDAVSHYDQVAKTNPPTDIQAMTHKVRANIFLYHKKNYQAAMSELTQGLELAKSDPQLVEMYSQCDYYLKHGGAEPQPMVVNAEQENYFKEQSNKLSGTEVVQPYSGGSYTTVNTNKNKQDSNNSSQYTEPVKNQQSQGEEFSENDEESYTNNDDFSYEEEFTSDDDNDEEFTSDDDNDEEFTSDDNDEEFVSEDDEFTEEFTEDDGDVEDRE
ncbi:hypothetical protein [Candidatus Uabimicrobium sp. HlEnr_7]|uniref:hypothetical protein n=1 Tax=Candidatus Uabimicrobium helgolandensis TaxID=3095367 RepID=UPI003556A9BD